MSNVASALQGEVYEGFVTVADQGPQGMITLRGDPSASAFQTGVKTGSGTKFPAMGRIETAEKLSLAWMSPDELLVLCPYNEVPDVIAALTKSLSGTHHLIANVSDARALIRVAGPGTREVMAKLTPADVAPSALRPGMFRRSKLAQVPAAFWMPDADSFHVICFRSVARYVFDILKTSAMPGGEVGFFSD